MIAQYFSSIAGIELVGIAGLLLSVTFFIVVALRAVRAPEAEIASAARLPLEDSSSESLHEAEL
jgi:hypothetical protein